jgi:hypothetical protein
MSLTVVGQMVFSIISSVFLIELASATEIRVVKITIENKTPQFQVVPTIEVYGKPPSQFLGVADNRFEVTFPVETNDWYAVANIKITWKHPQSVDGISDDFDQRISLRLRRSFPDSYYFPIYYSNDRSKQEMDRLEDMGDIGDQFEVYFRGMQIARYYKANAGPKHPLTRRAAKVAFFAAVKLAEQPKYYVVMSDDAERIASDSQDDAMIYSKRAEEARSVYWFDLAELENYINNNKCEFAQSMIRALQDKRGSEPNLYARRYQANPLYLDAKINYVQTKCGAAP